MVITLVRSPPDEDELSMSLTRVPSPLDFGFDAACKAAAYAGLYSNASTEVTRSLQVTCPTGNCTWPNITTEAFCYQCANITDRLKSQAS
jgi:hypothetical protein